MKKILFLFIMTISLIFKIFFVVEGAEYRLLYYLDIENKAVMKFDVQKLKEVDLCSLPAELCKTLENSSKIRRADIVVNNDERVLISWYNMWEDREIYCYWDGENWQNLVNKIQNKNLLLRGRPKHILLPIDGNYFYWTGIVASTITMDYSFNIYKNNFVANEIVINLKNPFKHEVFDLYRIICRLQFPHKIIKNDIFVSSWEDHDEGPYISPTRHYQIVNGKWKEVRQLPDFKLVAGYCHKNSFLIEINPELNGSWENEFNDQTRC